MAACGIAACGPNRIACCVGFAQKVRNSTHGSGWFGSDPFYKQLLDFLRMSVYAMAAWSSIYHILPPHTLLRRRIFDPDKHSSVSVDAE
jgi:hypothetical protein